MFAPTKVWRKWHRCINQNQRRFATVSALAASALPSLVMARGHAINGISEVPLVVSDEAKGIAKTKDAVALLTKLGAYADVERVADSKKIRCGVGKIRNRRYTARRGPLVIYDNKIEPGFRNLPGVETCRVSALNLLQLAPGGHVGRFCIWTESAFKKLDSIYGTWRKAATEKVSYNLPRPIMANADVARLINSDEIQSVIRRARDAPRRSGQKKNPLTNLNALLKLNPYAKTFKRNAILFDQAKDVRKKNAKVAKEAAKAAKTKTAVPKIKTTVPATKPAKK